MGVLLALLSSVVATAKDLVSKRLAAQLDGMVSTFASFSFALPYYLVVLIALYLHGSEKLDYSLEFFVLVLLRSITDTFAEALKMYALAYGDISLVASFFSLSPLFLLVLSPLITGDEPSSLGIAAVLLVVTGSLLMVYRPTRQADWASQKKGILLALVAAVFFALNSCFDRLAVEKGTPVFAGFAMTALSALFLLPFVIRRQRRAALWAYRADFALRGFLEVTFMVCKLSALQYLPAPEVVCLQRSSLLLSIVGGRVFFKEVDFGKRLTAGLLILSGVVLVALAQMRGP